MISHFSSQGNITLIIGRKSQLKLIITELIQLNVLLFICGCWNRMPSEKCEFLYSKRIVLNCSKALIDKCQKCTFLERNSAEFSRLILCVFLFIFSLSFLPYVILWISYIQSTYGLAQLASSIHWNVTNLKLKLRNNNNTNLIVFIPFSLALFLLLW